MTNCDHCGRPIFEGQQHVSLPGNAWPIHQACYDREIGGVPVSTAIRQFLCDAWHFIPSEGADACLEGKALRKSWLAALEIAGLTEPEALEACRGLWMRAPKEAAE